MIPDNGVLNEHHAAHGPLYDDNDAMVGAEHASATGTQQAKQVSARVRRVGFDASSRTLIESPDDVVPETDR